MVRLLYSLALCLVSGNIVLARGSSKKACKPSSSSDHVDLSAPALHSLDTTLISRTIKASPSLASSVSRSKSSFPSAVSVTVSVSKTKSSAASALSSGDIRPIRSSSPVIVKSSRAANTSVPTSKIKTTCRSGISSSGLSKLSELPFSSGRSAAYSCPSVNGTTSTSSVFVNLATSTRTYPYVITRTTFASIVFATVTAVSTSYIRAQPYSATSTVTQYLYTNVSIVVIPAPTTITIPTAAGFTAVACDPAYFGTVVTETFTYPYEELFISTSFTTPAEPGTSYVTVYSSTTTQTYTPTGTTTFYLSTIISSTSTRADPTSTVYAACATNNVFPRAPPYHRGDYIFSEGSLNTLVERFIPAVDAVDCCASCQANSSCAVSAYYTGPGICLHYPTINSTTCDVTSLGARVLSTGNTSSVYISNSPCGRWSFNNMFD